MRSKLILLLLIFSKSIFSIEVDGIIKGNKTEFYYVYHGSSKKTYTFEIQRDSNKNYFEIFYFYSKLKVLKEDEIIYQSSDTEEAGEYSFTFEHDGSTYYMNIEYLSYKEYGFEVQSQAKPFNYLYGTEISFDVVRKRSISLKIKNNKKKNELICIRMSTSVRIKTKGNEETQIEENGKKIDYKFLSERRQVDYYDYYFYIILVDEISISSIIYSEWYGTTIYYASTATIRLDDHKINELTDDQAISLNDGSFKFYIIKNDNPFFEISVLKNSKLYIVKSITEYIEIEDINKYDQNTNIFMLNSENNKGAFFIKFMDEKNSMEEEQKFNLYICDTRDYKMTIINHNKTEYMQIGFKSNYYINLASIYIIIKNQEIKYSYKDENDYYIFEFKNALNYDENPIILKFKKLKELSDFAKVELFYKTHFYTPKEEGVNTFLQASRIMAYICFGIFAILFCYAVCIKEETFIIKKKLLSVFIFKKYKDYDDD